MDLPRRDLLKAYSCLQPVCLLPVQCYGRGSLTCAADFLVLGVESLCVEATTVQWCREGLGYCLFES